jgi:hypothetical protein
MITKNNTRNAPVSLLGRFSSEAEEPVKMPVFGLVLVLISSGLAHWNQHVPKIKNIRPTLSFSRHKTSDLVILSN